MRPRTLAGRLSSIQTVVTLAALATVVVGTGLVVAGLLDRKRDAALEETARRGVELANGLGVYAQDAEWMERELSEIRASDVRVEFQDPTGFALASSGPGHALQKTTPGCQDQAALRVCAAKAGVFTVAAATDRSRDSEEYTRLMAALSAVAAIAGALVSLVSRRVARRALSPLTDLTVAVTAIQPGNGGRVGAAIPFAELELLRARFDELVSRFEAALGREKRFTAQASHELRTPLGVARAEIEALAETRDVEAGCARALAAMDRLSELVQTLLWFARAQERLDEERLGVVNLADIVRAQIADRERLNPSRRISCTLPDELLVQGDEHLLGHACSNLLENAIKHGTAEHVSVVAELEASALRLRVSNSGVLSADTERLFEPFHRPAGSATVPGFGLGLPLARSVARAHGGDVKLESHGTNVVCTLTLPLVDSSDDGPFKLRSRSSGTDGSRTESPTP